MFKKGSENDDIWSFAAQLYHTTDSWSGSDCDMSFDSYSQGELGDSLESRYPAKENKALN